MRDRPYDEVMIERFRADPAYAVELLNSIFEDGDDQGELRIFLPLMLKAFSHGHDESQIIQDINHLTDMFRAMGLQLSVTSTKQTQSKRTRTDNTKVKSRKKTKLSLTH